MYLQDAAFWHQVLLLVSTIEIDVAAAIMFLSNVGFPVFKLLVAQDINKNIAQNAGKKDI